MTKANRDYDIFEESVTETTVAENLID